MTDYAQLLKNLIGAEGIKILDAAEPRETYDHFTKRMIEKWSSEDERSLRPQVA